MLLNALVYNILSASIVDKAFFKKKNYNLDYSLYNISSLELSIVIYTNLDRSTI